MKSYATQAFWDLYWALTPELRRRTVRAYRLWQDNPSHPSLRFKRVSPNRPIYSVRIGLGHRALGLLKDDTIIWFWIGDHEAYDRLIGR